METPIEQAKSNGESDANQSTSEANSVPSAVEVTQLKSDVARLSAMVSALQSQKDKGINAVKQQNQSLAGQIESLASYLGLSPEQVQEAQRKSVLDQIVNERIGETQPAAPVSGGTEKAASSSKLDEIDAELGIQANDPRVTQLKIAHANDPLAYTIALSKLGKSAPAPTPAEQPLPSGSSPASRSDASQDAAYRTELAAAAQNQNIESRIRAIAEVKNKYQKF